MAAGELGPALGTARVYWQGAHATQRVAGRPFQSPLGKLHSEGLAVLRAAGWEQVPATDARVPAFAFTTRKGADFPAAGAGLPTVRQLPQRCTAVLDDKLLLAECLEAEGCAHISPRTWTDTDAFVRQCRGGGSGKAAVAGGGEGPEAGLWFLKHRHGVQGKAVYPFPSLPALLERLHALNGASATSDEQGGSRGAAAGGGGGRSSRRRHFIVQEGVAPPLLLPDGRKFTMRAHLLLLLEAPPRPAAPAAGQRLESASARQQGEQAAGQEQQPQLRAYVHRDVVVTPHASPCPSQAHPAAAAAGGGAAATAATSEAATAGAAAAGGGGAADLASVHVSSRGRHHPRPFLLCQLSTAQQQQQPQPQQDEGEACSAADAALQQSLWRQVCETCGTAVAAAARRGLIPPRADPGARLCHLFALDFAVAAPAAPPAAREADAAPPLPDGAAGQRQAPPPAPRVLLLEANSYPAIASGTMAAVPRRIYTRLVADLLGLAVLPALEGRAPQAGGFHRVL